MKEQRLNAKKGTQDWQQQPNLNGGIEDAEKFYNSQVFEDLLQRTILF